MVRKIFTFYINDVIHLNAHFQGQRVNETADEKVYQRTKVQGGSNMTGTDLCVNKCKQSWSYLNHLAHLSYLLQMNISGGDVNNCMYGEFCDMRCLSLLNIH